MLLAGLGFAVITTACNSRGNNPGWEYAPDMYYSKGYEPYNQGDNNKINPYGMNMREPVAGTVAWGKEDYYYPYENNGPGYDSAKSLTYPANFEDNEGRGKYLYGIYCTPCHGIKGGNDGTVFQPGRLGKPTWKNYQDEYIRNLPVGQMYHTLTYGKNNMGSHAYALSPMDRWKVIHYVKELAGIGAKTNAADTAKKNETKPNGAK